MPIRRIDPDAARALIDAGVDVVDVSEPEEWAAGHIAGSRLVPLGEVMREPEQHLPHDRILFVCGYGVKSLAASTAATRIGHQEVYSLAGGTAAWAARGFPLER